MRCNGLIHSRVKRGERIKMITEDDVEHQAYEAACIELGNHFYRTEGLLDKPPSAWSKEEFDTVVEVVIASWVEEFSRGVGMAEKRAAQRGDDLPAGPPSDGLTLGELAVKTFAASAPVARAPHPSTEPGVEDSGLPPWPED
jgi:hypothetical protein